MAGASIVRPALVCILIAVTLAQASVLCPGRALGGRCNYWTPCQPSDVYEFGVCKRDCINDATLRWCPLGVCCEQGPNSEDGCEAVWAEFTFNHERRGCNASRQCEGNWLIWEEDKLAEQNVAREVTPCYGGY
jgi:hypothetical protein